VNSKGGPFARFADEQQIPWVTVGALGVTQIFAWGSTYYLLTVLAAPIAADTGWPIASVVGGLSLGLLVAGLISPRTGQAIQRYGGRPVLAASSVILGVGLTGLAASPNLITYLASWTVLGIGMGTGLYDAAFATLGRTYGAAARSAITALTLIAGFSSTICWPLSAFLVDHYGWRITCLAYGAFQLTLSLAVHLTWVPRISPVIANEEQVERGDLTRRGTSRRSLYVLAFTLTLIAIISAIMSVHLILFLRAGGATSNVAVGLAALLGPSQVGARLVEMLVGRHYHPIWTLIFATGLMAVGLGLLPFGMPILAVAVIFYGAGIGIAWIARGTVPLALFGSRDYAVRMGRLAFPSLVAQAISPLLGALLFDIYGAGPTLAILVTAALLALLTAVWLQRGT
jgi:predicted MFS family arabinose efflux permease